MPSRIRQSSKLVAVAALSVGLAACSPQSESGSEQVALDGITLRSADEELVIATDPEALVVIDTEVETDHASQPNALEGHRSNATAVIAEIEQTLTTEVLDPADANCDYLNQDDDAATRLNNWRIGRDEFLGIPHDDTLAARLEQRSLVEITADYGYTEETLVTLAEILHTECHLRAVEAGDMSEQQALNRVSNATANFEDLMHSMPDEEGRGAGPGTGGRANDQP